MENERQERLRRRIEELVRTRVGSLNQDISRLQQEINEKGVTEKYQNGANQFGVKKSSAVEVYNTMIKNHVQVMKQLTDLLPKDDEHGGNNNKDDGFDDFVNNR